MIRFGFVSSAARILLALLASAALHAAEPLEIRVEKPQLEVGESTSLTVLIDNVAEAPRHTYGNPSTIGEERYLPGDEPIYHFRLGRDGRDYVDDGGKLAAVGTPVHGSWFFPHLRAYPQFDGSEWRARLTVELTYTATVGMQPGEITILVDGGQGGGPGGPQTSFYRATAKVLVGVAATEAAGPLGVGLACDTAALDADGTALCNAQVSGQGPFGRVTYAWTVDGSARAEFGDTLPLGGLAAGTHQVSVRATDEEKQVSSRVESITLTRAGAGGTTPAETPALGVVTGPNPLVAGGAAVAIAAAIGALILRRLRRRAQPEPRGGAPASLRPGSLPELRVRERPKPTGAPEALAPVSPAPVSKPAVTRPGALPEQRRRDQEPERPQIQLTLRITPSVRTQQKWGTGAVHLWGDGVDLVIVGYEITVLTPGWKLDSSRPRDYAWDPGRFEHDGVRNDRIKLIGGAAKKVWAFERFGADSPLHAPTTARQWVVQADWLAQGERDLAIAVQLGAWLVNASGEQAEASAEALASIRVIGANPRLTLVGGEQPVDADGSSRTRIEPVLELFDAVYAGGLAVGTIADRAALEKFFEFEPERFRVSVDNREFVDPDANLRRQGLALRCKFRLDDSELERVRAGVELRFSVSVTGVGQGEAGIRSNFDWMASEHYRLCAQHLSEIATTTPACVHLRASEIVFEQPPHLPRLDLESADEEVDAAEGNRQYTQTLRAQVRSASGKPIKGSSIRSDRSSGGGGSVLAIDTWKLMFFYDPPVRKPLKLWDRASVAMRSSSDERIPSAMVADVDEEGWLQFELPGGHGKLASHCVYDHWKEYFNRELHYLSGQCCTLNVSVVADGKERIGTRFFVGPPCKLYFYVDGRDQGIVNHVFIGLADERAKEIRAGFYPFLSVGGLVPYEAQSVAGMAGGVVLGGAAVIQILKQLGLSLIPGGFLVKMAYYLTLTTGASAAGFGGVVAGTTGVGRVEDEGALRVPSQTEPIAHAYSVCRGWDISHAGYQRVLALMKTWKRESDLLHTWYDVSAISEGGFAGNCVSFTRDICSIIGVELPFPTDAIIERPGNFAAALEADPRHETNQVPDSGAEYRHPWDYGANYAFQLLEINGALGRSRPPTTPGSGDILIQLVEPGPALTGPL